MTAMIVIGLMFVGIVFLANRGRNTEIDFENPYSRVFASDLEKARAKNNATLSFDHPYSRVFDVDLESVQL